MNITFEKACTGDSAIIIELFTRCKKAPLDCDIYQWGDWGNGYQIAGTEIFDSKPAGNKEYYCYEKRTGANL